MASKASPPESFDSTAKLMVEAFAKASAELEKSVSAYTEQLISFNEGVQKSLEEELRLVSARMESCIFSNLDELGHNKHLMMKRLLEAERAELDTLSDTGRQVRAALNKNAQQIEEKIESFVQAQISALREFLKEPETQINDFAKDCRQQLDSSSSDAANQIKKKQEEFRKQLAQKVEQLERAVKEEAQQARQVISQLSEQWSKTLQTQREGYGEELAKSAEETMEALKLAEEEGLSALEAAEREDKSTLTKVGDEWKVQIGSHADGFSRLIGGLSAVLRENFETKLANVAEQARQEITMLSDHAHEKIAATRNELEVDLRDLEKEYIHELEATLRKLEAMVNEHANDKRNSGVARQHKAQKLRDQMQAHLRRFGASLVDSIKDSATAMENEFDRATDGFLVRIEGAKTSAVELLERESKLMQKDIDRTLKEFQREMSDEEAQLGKIEHAGQDAVVTVIACRKAMLSFKGE